MLLALDIGNTEVTVGLFGGRRLLGQWRLTTVADRTPDEWGMALDACLRRYRDAGAKHLLCTDIARDGMMRGPNIDLYRMIVARGEGFALQASGGVRDVADIRAAREAGCAGAVLGRALLEGGMTIEDALTC